jgi:hypothetical protein
VLHHRWHQLHPEEKKISRKNPIDPVFVSFLLFGLVLITLSSYLRMVEQN